jgi:hypothetical protein
VKEHVHDGTVPRCTCGYRWDWWWEYQSDGTTYYTSDEVMQKYRALYGEPQVRVGRVEDAI